MKLPKQTEPVSRTDGNHDARQGSPVQKSKGISPSGDCGCPIHCAGRCVSGNCWGMLLEC